MTVGKQVVCVNDTFTDIIRTIYQELPVKGATYTVREVTLGRETIITRGEPSVTVRILLKELKNPVDPLHKDGQELGFNAERFREIDEHVETEEREEPVHIGISIGDDGDGWKNQ